MPEQEPVRRRRRSPARRKRQRTRRMSGRVLLKATIGLVGPAAAIIGTLLGLNVIHPFGGGGNALAAAAGHVVDAGTARGALTVDVSVGGKLIRHVTGKGEFDFRAGEFHETLDTRSS